MGKRKTIMLMVTHRCNLRCTYCYEPKLRSDDLTFDKARQYITSAVGKMDNSYTEFELQFMGGEPLLKYQLIKDIAEWLWNTPQKKILCQIFVPTNGTILNDDMRKWFIDNKNHICLGLSFDGNRTMQDGNRSNSFSEIDLDFFRDTWPKQSIKMTISPLSLPYLSEGVQYLHLKGFSYITADIAMGAHVRWEEKHLKMLSEQLEKLSNYYVFNRELIPFSLLRADISQIVNRRIEEKKCGCGETLTCIEINGEHYACHLFSPVSAKVSQAKASQNIDFADYSLFVNSQCKQCLLQPLCPSCYGMNYITSGMLNTPEPFYCQAYKIQFLSSCAMQFQMARDDNDEQQMKLINKIIKQWKQQMK